jgi:hypothetical protein
LAVPGIFPLAIYRGDSYRWQFVLWMDAGKTQPADLSDVTPTAEIRDKPGGSKVTPLVCTVTLPNTIEVGLTAIDSKAITISSGVWDLQLTYENDDVITVLGGGVDITPDITGSGKV